MAEKDGYAPMTLDEHRAELEAWASGQKSWTNIFHPDHATVAICDAMEVVKHAAAIVWLTALASTGTGTTDRRPEDG